MAKRDQRHNAVIALAAVLLGGGFAGLIALKINASVAEPFEWGAGWTLACLVAALAGIALFSSLIFGWPIRAVAPDRHEAKERLNREHLAESAKQLKEIQERDAATEDDYRQQEADGERVIKELADWLKENYSSADRELFVRFTKVRGASPRAKWYSKMNLARENLAALMERYE